MSFFSKLFSNIRTTESNCDCHGHLKQVDANLPDGTRVRVMQSREGYHVAVGSPGDVPEAVQGDNVIGEIFRQWFGGE